MYARTTLLIYRDACVLGGNGSGCFAVAVIITWLPPPPPPPPPAATVAAKACCRAKTKQAAVPAPIVIIAARCDGVTVPPAARWATTM